MQATASRIVKIYLKLTPLHFKEEQVNVNSVSVELLRQGWGSFYDVK